MKNFIAAGMALTFTAPYAVSSGGGFQVGSLFAVAENDAENAASVVGHLCGVYDLSKTSAQAWTFGDKIYWDNSNKVCTTDATAGMLIGTAVAAAANPSSTGRVRLNGVAPSSAEGPQTAITSLTDSSGGTANNTVAAIGATNSGDVSADINNNFADLAAKVNAILAALRAHGVIAS